MDLINSRLIHSAPESGDCVAYVMSRDQRVADNLALLAAQQKAMELHLPLAVIFNLHQNVGVRAYEHVHFMLEGLTGVSSTLASLNISFVLTADESRITLIQSLQSLNPAVIFCDFSPLHSPRKRIKNLAKILNKTTVVVDTHNIIPTWVASAQQEFAAHTFRHKVHKHLARFLVEPEQVVWHPHSFTHLPGSLSIEEGFKYINAYPKRGIRINFVSGEKAAMNHLDAFLNSDLSQYATQRNNMAVDRQSNLSPYLHFGQIYSLRVALDTMQRTGEEPLLYHQPKLASAPESPKEADGMNALFEEMIVRKELSDNFCLFAQSYRSFESVPNWAKATLKDHANDQRDVVYSREQLEKALTHDPSWNAAQKELTKFGKIHGYMRMYWAKKILEWSADPETALETALYLNDTYSVDGGDPNGYVGVLWAIAGLHDRPWAERAVFGKIRYMNEAGLKRKFDIDAYIHRVK